MSRRLATVPELHKDALSVAQQVVSCWDEEVEVVIIIAAKGQKEFAYATSMHKERLHNVLDECKRLSTMMVKRG